MLSKMMIALFPLLVWIVLVLAFKFLHLRKLTNRKLKIPDVFTVFLAYGLYAFSGTFTKINILPYYLLIVSGLSLTLLLLDLFYYRQFKYGRFLKLWWRITFIITFVSYIAMTVVILMK